MEVKALSEGTVKWFSEKRVMVLSSRKTVRTYLSTTPQSTHPDSRHSLKVSGWVLI